MSGLKRGASFSLLTLDPLQTDMLIRTQLSLLAFFLLATSAQAQQGYEFEVYGTGISPRGSSELELHTNFVPSGSQLAAASRGNPGPIHFELVALLRPCRSREQKEQGE